MIQRLKQSFFIWMFIFSFNLQPSLLAKSKSSKSIGLPSNGSLKNGEKLSSEGKGYITKNKNNLYGTNETVKYIKKCAVSYRKAFPKNPPLVIGDLSKKGGDALSPHLSHQSGRDVDIGYLLKSKKKFNEFVETTPENIDKKRTWFFLQCLLNTKDIKYIFMTKSLQDALYKYLLKKSVSKKRLSQIMEYPNGTGEEVILKISNDHINHFHVRFKCPKGDKDCRD